MVARSQASGPTGARGLRPSETRLLVLEPYADAVGRRLVGRLWDLGITPLVVGDLLKLALAGALLPSGWLLVKRVGRYEER